MRRRRRGSGRYIIIDNYNGYYYYRISHFSALAGKYSPILGCCNQEE